MIAYFSATGNSRAVAQAIAERTGDTLLDIGEAWRTQNTAITLAPGEALGFVFPVYRWTTPPLIDRFIDQATITDAAGNPARPGYCYAVVTYGYFPGNEMEHFARRLKAAHGIGLSASFHVASNANCIYVSNPPDAQRAAARNSEMARDAAAVARAVADRDERVLDTGTPLGRLLSKATDAQEKRRSTNSFNVIRERCVSCGTCEEVCPTGSISFKDGAPTWSGDECTECLACIHRCPNEATQYGKISLNRRRYTHPSLVGA